MTNAELIDALRKCGDEPYDITKPCKVSPWKLMRDSADAIERLADEVDRKDNALQAWVTTWESADAVPVVRCGQCKHGSKCLLGVVQCKMYGYKHQADWFCADGERRTL